MARNYRLEYDRYQGRPEQIKKRDERNAARNKLEKEGLVHKGDGMDVDHARPLAKGGSNDRSNLRVRSASDNRAFARARNAGMK